MMTCVHGLSVDDSTTPIAEQCQVCDWCPRCQAVREYAQEKCLTCGYIWGEGE